MVSYLLNAYEETQNKLYLDKAKEITEDWIKNNPNDRISNNWAWADHPVSSRILVMTNLLEHLKSEQKRDYRFIGLLLESFEEHLIYQVDEKKYKIPHNHGIMQDRALIQAAISLSNVKESSLWVNIARGRLNKQINSLVDENGVQLEHSPFYHLYTMQLLNSIIELKYNNNLALDSNILKRFDSMKEYLVYITKPDLTLPLIGDSTKVNIINDFKDDYLKYVVTEGREGLQPKEIDKVYKDSGVAIFRDEWASEEAYKNMTHLVFNAGYHSRVHKHADDLSFVLSSLGEDIFIDAGKYEYNNTKWREYISSSKGHNMITVDNTSYKIENKNYGSFITDYILEEGYSWVRGEHNLFQNVKLSREILYIKPNVLLIFDKANSNTHHSYEQNFNLGKTFEIDYEQSDENLVVANNDNGDITVTIKQLKPIDSYRIYKGYNNEKDRKNPIRGYASEVTNELFEINQIEFHKNGFNVEFVTLISLESSRYSEKIEFVDLNYVGNTKVIEYKVDGNNNTVILPSK